MREAYPTPPGKRANRLGRAAAGVLLATTLTSCISEPNTESHPSLSPPVAEEGHPGTDKPDPVPTPQELHPEPIPREPYSTPTPQEPQTENQEQPQSQDREQTDETQEWLATNPNTLAYDSFQIEKMPNGGIFFTLEGTHVTDPNETHAIISTISWMEGDEEQTMSVATASTNLVGTQNYALFVNSDALQSPDGRESQFVVMTLRLPDTTEDTAIGQFNERFSQGHTGDAVDYIYETLELDPTNPDNKLPNETVYTFEGDLQELTK